MIQQVITPSLLREASRKVDSQKQWRAPPALHSQPYCTRFRQKRVTYALLTMILTLFNFSILQYRFSSYRRMASTAKKTAEEREDTDYDPGTSGSEAGTPKKGRKKKETPDPGLTLGTEIENHLKPDGRQLEVELENVRIDQEKTKGQIRRKYTKLLQKRIESLQAAPPTGPLHVVLWIQ